MKKVCVITGTRAEYGLLRPLIKRIETDQDLELQIIATGMHLSPEFGITYREIEKDGFTIHEKVEILLSSDTSVGISKSMGLAMISFSESLARLQPDILVILGDRYEIFAVASAASVMKIPVAHIHGGETTEGAFDEAFRHSITKMSYYHFTSTEEYRNRVIQLGENPSRVFNVGAIGIENIMMLDLLAKSDLEESIDFDVRGKFALITFHPVTLENSTSKEQFRSLLDALDQFNNLKVIFTKSNSDTDGRIINQMIDDYVRENKDRTIAFTSMGQLKYLSAMSYTDIVIGNSSSGIIEAPSFHVPTVNIGDRQKGRIQADSTVNCKPVTEEIKAAIMKALDPEFKEAIKNVSNPYGNGDVSSKIMERIKPLLDQEVNIKKSFYDLKR